MNKYSQCLSLPKEAGNPSKKAELACSVKDALFEMYPGASCALDYAPGDDNDAFRLLIMARLSAQCTDKRVNEVSKQLFKSYPTPYAMADADINELERSVYPCGVYKVKSRNILDMSRIICEKYGGKVPDDEKELLALPGVGQKITNLMMGDVFGKPAIVADTHCIRISNKLGLCSSADPDKITAELTKLIDYKDRAAFCHAAVLFGREFCTARSPRCELCPLAKKLNERFTVN
ncbi:Endonuclease III [bioreactor metagenome]|uniref:Endonuclease III n=1 Tax=bioreactor metagenome TaxID=1076179 RepID=A0A645E714_9ZZZZ